MVHGFFAVLMRPSKAETNSNMTTESLRLCVCKDSTAISHVVVSWSADGMRLVARVSPWLTNKGRYTVVALGRDGKAFEFKTVAGHMEPLMEDATSVNNIVTVARRLLAMMN